LDSVKEKSRTLWVEIDENIVKKKKQIGPKSKSDNLVVNENLNLAQIGNQAIEIPTKIEIFLIGMVAVLVCLLIVRTVKHYFKKSVQAYAVNV
jgi:hypothetical protein